MWLLENDLSAWLIRIKGFILPGSIQIGLRSNGKRSCGLMSPDSPCSQSDGRIRVRREEVEVMHPLYLVPTVQPVGAVLRSGVASLGQVEVQQRYVPEQCGPLTA